MPRSAMARDLREESRVIEKNTRRASILRDGFFDDIGVDFSATKTPGHQSFSSY